MFPKTPTRADGWKSLLCCRNATQQLYITNILTKTYSKPTIMWSDLCWREYNWFPDCCKCKQIQYQFLCNQESHGQLKITPQFETQWILAEENNVRVLPCFTISTSSDKMRWQCTYMLYSVHGDRVQYIYSIRRRVNKDRRLTGWRGAPKGGGGGSGLREVLICRGLDPFVNIQRHTWRRCYALTGTPGHCCMYEVREEKWSVNPQGAVD